MTLTNPYSYLSSQLVAYRPDCIELSVCKNRNYKLYSIIEKRICGTRPEIIFVVDFKGLNITLQTRQYCLKCANLILFILLQARTLHTYVAE